MQWSFYYFLKHPGIVSSMITYMHISNILTDRPRLTSLLISFYRINCVCRRSQELKKMGCFFLSVRRSISYTCAWPVFCWAVSPKHGHSPCVWDSLLLSVSPCSVRTPLLSCLQHTRKAFLEETCKMYCNKELSQSGVLTVVTDALLLFPSRWWQSVSRSTERNSRGSVIFSPRRKTAWLGTRKPSWLGMAPLS